MLELKEMVLVIIAYMLVAQSVITRLQAGWLDFDSWQGQGRDFFLPQCPDWSWGPPALYPVGMHASFPWGIKGLEHEADHLCVVPGFRMHGAVPPLSHTSPWHGV